MAEYIKRDNALKICDWYANEFAEVYIYFKELKMELKSLPAADVQPVKHGKWMYCSIEDMFHCTRCDAVAVRNSFVYCPICGAKMDGE